MLINMVIEIFPPKIPPKRFMHILLSLFSFFFFKFLLKKKEKESVLQYYFLLDSYIYIYRRETDYKNSVILSTEWNP